MSPIRAITNSSALAGSYNTINRQIPDRSQIARAQSTGTVSAINSKRQEDREQVEASPEEERPKNESPLRSGRLLNVEA